MVTLSQVVDINVWAVLLAAGVAYFFSAVWYSPVLFGKDWQKMTLATYKSLSPTSMKAMGAVSMVGSAFAYIIMAYVLAVFTSLLDVGSASEGVVVAAWIAFGFVLTQGLVHALYHNLRRKLWVLNTTHEVAVVLIMGYILGTWL